MLSRISSVIAIIESSVASLCDYNKIKTNMSRLDFQVDRYAYIPSPKKLKWVFSMSSRCLKSTETVSFFKTLRAKRAKFVSKLRNSNFPAFLFLIWFAKVHPIQQLTLTKTRPVQFPPFCSLRSQCCKMRHFRWFSNTVISYWVFNQCIIVFWLSLQSIQKPLQTQRRIKRLQGEVSFVFHQQRYLRIPSLTNSKPSKRFIAPKSFQLQIFHWRFEQWK